MDNKSVGVCFVVTYHPQLKNVSKIIKKHVKHLYADPKVRSVYKPLPFASFRSLQNLRKNLVKSELYLQEQKIGSSSPHCLVCKNIEECDQSPVISPKKHLRQIIILTVTANA